MNETMWATIYQTNALLHNGEKEVRWIWIKNNHAQYKI